MLIDIFGKKIWYEIYGAEHKDTLLYLHGGPGASCLDFANQARALSEKMKVVIFDQFGVLRSEAIAEDESYSMEYQIEMIEEMRKLLGIEKWSILGHSYGGMLAVLYAYTYPNSICKIILECPSLWFEDSARSTADYLSEHINSLNNEQAAKLCEKMKFADYQDKTEVVWDLSNLLGYVTDMELRFYLHSISLEEYEMSMDASDITDEMWGKGERHLTKLLETQPVPNGSVQKKVRMTDNFLPMLPEITAPILLINGKYDPACTKNQIEYILSNAQHVRQVVFESSGHFPRLEEPQKYTDAVLDFMLAVNCMVEEISFPEHEYESIRNYLNKLGYCYTTRVYKEIGKYKVGELYTAPWGDVLRIDEVETYWKVSDRPFYEEMNEDERTEVRKYSEDIGLPYEFIKFSKTTA